MFAATSLSLIAILGLGYLAQLSIGGLRLWPAECRTPAAIFTWLTVMLLAGLQLNYALGIVIPELDVLAIIHAGVAVVGGVAALAAVYLLIQCRSWPRSQLVVIAAIVALFLIYTLSVTSMPLKDWDARSIWFFHAKVIYFDGGLHSSTFWSDAAFGWTHQEYPKLLPLLGAQLAHKVGFWNEYIPKGSLLLLLFPFLVGYAAITKLRPVYLVLIVIMFGYLRGYLWNGYVDAYVAVYAVLALLAFQSWLTGGPDRDLTLAALATGVTLSLKQEGVIVLVAIALAALLAGRTRTILKRVVTMSRLQTIRFVAVAALAVGPAVVWRSKIAAWSLKGDMRLDRLVDSLIARVTDFDRLGESIAIMVAYALTNTFVAEALAMAVVLATAGAVRRILWPWHMFPLLMACVYGAAILLIYLGTPHDFRWHIETSFLRVTLTLVSLLLVSHFLILDALWQDKSEATDGIGVRSS